MTVYGLTNERRDGASVSIISKRNYVRVQLVLSTAPLAKHSPEPKTRKTFDTNRIPFASIATKSHGGDIFDGA